MPFTKIAMNDAEKRAFMARTARQAGIPAEPVPTIAEWPATIPPFLSPVSLFAAPDGRAVIGRLASTKYPKTRYDIVTRSGKLEAQLELGENEKIVGFGTGNFVYVATTDSNGIQRIARHAWQLVTRP